MQVTENLQHNVLQAKRMSACFLEIQIQFFFLTSLSPHLLIHFEQENPIQSTVYKSQIIFKMCGTLLLEHTVVRGKNSSWSLDNFYSKCVYKFLINFRCPKKNWTHSTTRRNWKFLLRNVFTNKFPIVQACPPQTKRGEESKYCQNLYNQQKNTI